MLFCRRDKSTGCQTNALPCPLSEYERHRNIPIKVFRLLMLRTTNHRLLVDLERSIAPSDVQAVLPGKSKDEWFSCRHQVPSFCRRLVLLLAFAGNDTGSRRIRPITKSQYAANFSRALYFATVTDFMRSCRLVGRSVETERRYQSSEEIRTDATCEPVDRQVHIRRRRTKLFIVVKCVSEIVSIHHATEGALVVGGAEARRCRRNSTLNRQGHETQIAHKSLEAKKDHGLVISKHFPPCPCAASRPRLRCTFPLA
jgi:hypothetical protein